MSKELIAVMDQQGVATSATLTKQSALAKKIQSSIENNAISVLDYSSDHLDQIAVILEVILDTAGAALNTEEVGCDRIHSLLRIASLAKTGRYQAQGLSNSIDVSKEILRDEELPTVLIMLKEMAAPDSSLMQENISSLGLAPRAFDSLSENGIKTIGQLIGMDPMTLARLPQIGQGSIRNIKEKLDAKGLSLSVEVSHE